MVESPDTEGVERTPPVRPRLLAIVVVVAVAIEGLALLPAPAPVPSEESLPTLDSVLVDVASPEEVAKSFMKAWVRGDGEAAASLFRPAAKFHGVEPESGPFATAPPPPPRTTNQGAQPTLAEGPGSARIARLAGFA